MNTATDLHSQVFMNVMAKKEKRERKEKRNMVITVLCVCMAICGIIFCSLNTATASAEAERATIFIEDPITGAVYDAAPYSPVKAEPSLNSTVFPYEEDETFGENDDISPDAMGFLDAYAQYELARMAMAEAEGEDIEGKALVMQVILNRIEDWEFPDTVNAVISQPGAFTSYSNGRYDRVEPDEGCWEALDMVLNGWDGSEGALYFEAQHPGTETWHSNTLVMLFQHGGHIFYTDPERLEGV